MTAVKADLLDERSVREALHGLTPDIVLITAWQRQPTEQENIAVNSAMVRNVLTPLEPAGSVRHVALMTGLKHYLGPFEDYGTHVSAETPFQRTNRGCPRPTSTTRKKTNCSPEPAGLKRHGACTGPTPSSDSPPATR